MTEIIETNDEIIIRTRPLGVWILTIYALLFAGISVALGTYALLMGIAVEMGGTLAIIFSIVLDAIIVISAIGAWQGKETARKILLVFVTVHYVFIGINNYMLIQSGLPLPEELEVYWGRVIRGVLYPAVYIWYFTRKTTREYYQS